MRALAHEWGCDPSNATWLVDRLDHDETHVHRRGRDFWLEQVSPPFTVRRYAGVWRCFFFGRFYLNVVSHVCRRWTTAILVVAVVFLATLPRS